MDISPQHIDCACLIHSNGYDWAYVEKLHKMLEIYSSREIRLHVYTEAERTVPQHMIKHALTEWSGIKGPKKSWWYKMQLFNSQHHRGPLLYFDLDVVITRNIDWIFDCDLNYFWAIHDFRRLWRPNWQGMNSSVMYWDTERWGQIWKIFENLELKTVLRRHHGDQDYLNAVIPRENLRFLETEKIKSWRWQIKDGGMNVSKRTYRSPNAGSLVDPKTSIIIFHGDPKPHQIHDPVIQRAWTDL